MKYFILTVLVGFSALSFGQEDTDTIWSTFSGEDVYEFSVYRAGCFHTEAEIITVKKDGEHFFGQYTKAGDDQKILSITELNAIEGFYTELANKDTELGFCTSTNTYIVKLNGKVQTTFVDSTCSGWSPFTDLVSAIYPSKDIEL